MRKFRLWVNREHTHYFMCYIFRTRSAMLWHNQRLNGKVDVFEAQGTYITTSSDPKYVGNILLHLKVVGAGVVSHEIAHIVGFYFHKHSIYPLSCIGDSGPATEQFAWITGYLNCQFWNQWHRLRVWASCSTTEAHRTA
jgi:hypothetical protein